MLYFPAKNCKRSTSAWYGSSQFLNRTYCVVPRQNWTKLGGLSLPLSDFLLVLCRRILPDHFRALDNSQGPRHQATIFSAVLHGALDRANDARTLLQIWWLFTIYILRKWVWSLDPPPSLVASALIMESTVRGIQDLACLVTFLQDFIAVAIL